MSTIAKLNSVTHRYGDVYAIEDISLDIPSGCMVGLIGPDGVGKSTMVCHLAQFLALKGYRVCVIDCDSQASTTSVFGLNPDIDVDEEEEIVIIQVFLALV